MRRKTTERDDGFGSDSFLDVVANIVGILIILVMVAGVRAGQASLASVTPEDRAAAEELKRLRSESASLESELRDLIVQQRTVGQQTAAATEERGALAMLSTAMEEEIETRRVQLGGQARDNFDLLRRVQHSKARLVDLEQQLHTAINTPSESKQIVSYPTPLSRTVHGGELHFQLRGGLIVPVPVEETAERLRRELRLKMERLTTQYELVDTLGPIGDFRVRYRLERLDAAANLRTGQGGTIIRVAEFTFVPVSSRLGEPLDVALAPSSLFRAELTGHEPRATTVTLWTYPDSFAEYRALKEELYSRGYQVAARPLPPGELIGGSPHGTRSAAQ